MSQDAKKAARQKGEAQNHMEMLHAMSETSSTFPLEDEGYEDIVTKVRRTGKSHPAHRMREETPRTECGRRRYAFEQQHVRRR